MVPAAAPGLRAPLPLLPGNARAATADAGRVLAQRGPRRRPGMSEYYSDGEGEEYEGEEDEYSRSGVDEDPEESEESEEEEEEEEWTNDHLKLLYMVSRYAACAETADDEETWIRKNSLLVLMYEGIVEGVYDYDYAPISQLVGRKRLWLNITQEGKDDIDDLRQGGLLNGLKLSSEDLQPVTAYQVSAKGKELASLIPREFRTEVDNLIYHDNELLEVQFEENAGLFDDEGEPEEPCFMLVSSGEDGFEKVSGITDTEDVSYVSSPYLPQCLRGFGPDTKDNTGQHRRGTHQAQNGP